MWEFQMQVKSNDCSFNNNGDTVIKKENHMKMADDMIRNDTDRSDYE